MEPILKALARAPLFASPDKEKGAPANDQSALKLHAGCPERTEPNEAALWREGGEYAEAWLTRVGAGTARPGELETLLDFLKPGVMFSAACRTLERAIGGRQ